MIGESYKKKIPSKRVSFKKYLIMVSMIAVSIVLFSVGLVFYTRTIRYIDEKLDLMEKNRFYRLYSDIDESINSINRVIEYLENSEILLSYLKTAENEKDNIYRQGVAIDNISKLLTNTKEYSTLAKQIFIITNKGEYSNYSTQMFNFKTLEKIRDSEFKDMMFFNYGTNKYYGIELRGTPLLDENMFFISNLKKDRGYNGKVFAIVDESFLYDTKRFYGDFHIIDQSGDYIWPAINSYDSSKQIKEQVLKNVTASGMGESSFRVQGTKITAKKLNSYNWVLIYSTDNSIIRQQRNNIIFYMLLSFFISVLFAYIFSRLISYRILQPINILTSITKDYDGKNNFNRYDNTNAKGISMRDSLFLYFFISILIPVIVFIVMFNATSLRITEEHTLDYYSTVFDKTADRINKYMERKLKAMQRITYSISMQKNATGSENTVFEADKIFNIINEDSVLGHERDIISIYNKAGGLLFTNYYMGVPDFDTSFYEKICNIKTGVIYNTQRDRYNRYLISIGMPIFYQENTPLEGYIKQDIDNADILQVYSDLISDSREAYISDDKGIVVSSSKVDNIGKNVVQKGYSSFKELINIGMRDSSKLLFYVKIRYLPWYLIYEVDYSLITASSRELIMNNIFIFIIVMLFVIIMVFVISNEIMKPLGKLNSFLFEFDPAKTGETNNVEYFFIDEISTLGSSFNKMAERIEELIDELIISGMIQNRLEGEKKAAEITALQAQISPHFLYNTLDMINYLVKQNKTDDVVTLINSLSDLFRFGISREEILIPIDEEIKYSKAYATIIGIIYDDRIKFAWNVNGSIAGYKTIRLILQPIIENAIYHGLKKREGVIYITCNSSRESIFFEVADNGMGIDNGELERIRENLKNSNGKKIGLNNVYSRLKLHFGEKAEFIIESIHMKGTSIKITIPKIQNL